MKAWTNLLYYLERIGFIFYLYYFLGYRFWIWFCYLLLLIDVEEQLDELQDELFFWLLEVLEEELEHEEIEVQDVDEQLELSEKEEEHETEVLDEWLELEELKPEDDVLMDIEEKEDLEDELLQDKLEVQDEDDEQE